MRGLTVREHLFGATVSDDALHQDYRPLMRSEGSGDAPELREILVVAVVALIPFEQNLTIWSHANAGNNFHLRVGLTAFHIPLTALLLLSVIDLARNPRLPRATLSRLIAVTATWFVVAFALNPSWRGVDALFHLAGAWAIWDTVVSARRHAQRIFLGALVTFGVLQAAIALAQRAGDGSAGIPMLEASGRGLTLRGGVMAVRGSFVHQYHFAGSVLVCTAAALVLLTLGTKPLARRLLLGAVLLLGVAVPMTFSRTAWLAIVPMIVVALVWLREEVWPAVATWTVGLVIGTVLSLDAIVERAQDTGALWTGSGRAPGPGSRRSFDTGRVELFQEGVDQISRHPLVGVGPANYVQALREHLRVADDPTVRVQPPHNVVLQFAAETGVLGGILTTALLVGLAVWAFRGGPLRVVAVLPLVPFFLLDLYAYTWQVGIVFCGMWIAVAQIAGRQPGSTSPQSAREKTQIAQPA